MRDLLRDLGRDLAAALRPALTLAPVVVREARRGPGLVMSSGFGGQGDGEPPTVRVGRRRRPTEEPAGGRERADAPERRREDAPEAQRPTGGGFGGSSGGSSGGGSSGGGFFPGRSSGGLPGGGLRIGCIGLILVGALLYVIFTSGRGDEPVAPPESQFYAEPTQDQGSGFSNPTEPAAVEVAPTRATVATATRVRTEGTSQPAPAGYSADQTWTVMLYQDADDKVLEQDIYIDLNEAERVGSDRQVRVVSQVDRYRGGFSGDGNWTGAKRLVITQDDNLSAVRSQVVEDLGEVNMADGQTLVDFVEWAMGTFPADRYVLILSDHGMGWPGGWSDPTSQGGDRRIPLSAQTGDLLFLHELDAALGAIRQQTGLDKFELIGLDACLMAQVEVFSALAPHARYAVASEETEPALGWAYTDFLRLLTEKPGMSGAELATAIVRGYIDEDQRVVDDQARAEFIGRGNALSAFGAPSSDEVARQLGQDITLSAVDLSQMPAVLNSLNDFAFAMQGAGGKALSQARSYAQSYTSIFGPGAPSGAIDLGNFIQLFQRVSGGALSDAGQQVLAAIDQAVLAEKHGPGKPGSTGMSIYFPTSQLYTNPLAGAQSYLVTTQRFAQESLWDDFLEFIFRGRRFERDAASVVAPESGPAPNAPGAGGITLSAVQASAQQAAPGRPITLRVTVSGANVGYVKLLAGFIDQSAKSIYVADSDYLESAETQEAGGVFYPVWPEERFNVEFEWEPLVFAISDGTNRAEALFSPQSYGRTYEEATYTVDGIFHYSDGEERFARLNFRNEELVAVFGFTGKEFTGAPREITPKQGDSFTVVERWLDLDAQGGVTKVAYQTGKTLSFGDAPWKWETLDAAAGQYIVGFIVEDLDGNAKTAYVPVTVR